MLALQLPATNVGGYTKRVTATAFVFLAYCIGNIIGPHAFLAKEAPIYQTGWYVSLPHSSFRNNADVPDSKVILACAAGQIALTFGLRALLIWRNAKRDKACQEAGIDMNAPEPENLEDLTDFQNPRFRYAY